MENTVSSSSDSQNLKASLRSNSPDNNLFPSLENLRLNSGVENDSACVYPGDNALRLPSNQSFARAMLNGYSSTSNGNRAGETMTTDRASIGRDSLCNNDFNLFSGLARQTSPTSFQHEPIAEGGSNVSYGFDNGRPAGNAGGFGFQQSLDHAHLPQMNTIIIENALTQDGSDILKDLLSWREPRITNKIFEGVIDFMFELMMSQHGHSLFAELIKLSSDDQLGMIIERITSHSPLGGIISVSKTRTGSRSIKKLIELLKKSSLIIKVIAALKEGFYELMISQTGSSVILKCVELIDTRSNELLYVAAIEHCLNLAVNARGCISLNYFIDNIRGLHRIALLHVIAKNSLYLSQDPSGNYVLQKVVELDNPDIIREICAQLNGHIVKLSMQKAGSHVVEKMLNSRGMHHVVKELVESKQLLQVAKDQYGNYVVQTALKASKISGSAPDEQHWPCILKLNFFLFHLLVESLEDVIINLQDLSDASHSLAFQRAGNSFYQELMTKLQEHLDALQHGYGRNVHSLINVDVPIN
ncbi:pumilio homolog 18-like [Herrania umbratica]|uniref:Pumilio homolog 18-like n=1 Tax=Herrania umbratica TaxID=108875 RepID=A0A6J1B5P3_9ROSI|nr:pumilio homolog 18-like [Herrania umbratica]